MLLIWFALINFLRLLISFLQLTLTKFFKFKNISFFNFLLERLLRINKIIFYNTLDFNLNLNNFFKKVVDFKTLYIITKFFNKNLNFSNYSESILNINLLNKLFFSNNLFELSKLVFIIMKLNQKLNTNSSNIHLVNFNYFINNAYSFTNYKNINYKYSGLTSSQEYTSIIPKITLIKNFVVAASKDFQEKTLSTWSIKYAPSNFLKYVNIKNSNSYNILYLRKNKVFNKGRYSRNRQYYRTGVYWCLYINIIAVIGIYYWFYGIAMNFGYLWWLLFIFIASFIVPKAIKYRLYNIKNLVKSYILDIIWLSQIIGTIFNYVVSNLSNLFTSYGFLNNYLLLNFKNFSKLKVFTFYKNLIIKNYIWPNKIFNSINSYFKN